MKKIVLDSPAKINWYLEVVNKRPDGYHNVKTLFERVNLCDKITLERIPENRIEVYCDNPDVPVDKANLVFMAAELLRRNFSISCGVRINIKKRIPVSAGLGGGSSNAAFVLLGLNRLWRLKLSRKTIIKYAKRIGADVAFFVANKPFAVGTSRGDNIQSLDIKRVFWHVLAVVNVRVSTSQVYKAFDNLSFRDRKDLRLTKPLFNTKIINYALNKGGAPDIRPLVYNNLGIVRINRQRRILAVIETLRKLDCLSGMSGSGPAVFSIASDKSQAEKIAGQLSRIKDLKVFVVRTY